MKKFIFILPVAFFLSCGPKAFEPDFANQHNTPVREKNESTLVSPIKGPDLVKLVDSLKLNRNKIHLEIDKSAYTMQVFHDTTLLKTYPVVFGFNPIDDKLKEGDGCTPEGTFNIRAKYPHGSWSKFIWIDYPNKESWKKHNQAKHDGLIPKNARIGGEVGIHGVPKGYDFAIDQRENWTLGCISLKTDDINELYSILGTKSYVVIRK